MMLKIIQRLLLAAAVPFDIAVIVPQAHAQSEVERAPFAKIGDWRVKQNAGSCDLINRHKATGGSLKISQYASGRANIWVTLAPAIPTIKSATDITITMGDFVENNVGQNGSSNTFYLVSLTDQFLRQFREGQNFALTIDGETLASYSLTGSAAAHRALQRCIGQLLTGPPIIPTSRDFSRKGPDLTGPFPPNRQPEPIRITSWISQNDYPSHNTDEGTVRFRAVVNPQGRVSGCQILESSGNAGLDQRTCRMIQRRARFEPATDADGKPIAQDWTSSVRWEIPD